MTEITHVCIHPNKHHSYSDVFGSREAAAYIIGRPDGSPMKLYNIGQSEVVSLLTTLPEELLEIVKEHYNLVEAAPAEPTIEDIEHLAQAITEAPPSVDVDLDDFNIDVESMELPQLRSLAKQLDIKGAHKLGKAKIIELIDELVTNQQEEGN